MVWDMASTSTWQTIQHTRGLVITSHSSGEGIVVHQEGKGFGMYVNMQNDTAYAHGIHVESKTPAPNISISQEGTGEGFRVDMNQDTSDATGIQVNYGGRNGQGTQVAMNNPLSQGTGMLVDAFHEGFGMRVYHMGSGPGALFEVANPLSAASALDVCSAGSGNSATINQTGSGAGLEVNMNGTGTLAAQFNNGDLVVNGGDIATSGNFFSNGTQLNVPDYVFAKDYSLESIEEHAAYMWKEKHLPAVSPAAEINAGKYNMAERREQILEELEKAHIYIEQLHKRLKKVEKQNLEIERLKEENQNLASQLADIYQLLQKFNK